MMFDADPTSSVVVEPGTSVEADAGRRPVFVADRSSCSRQHADVAPDLRLRPLEEHAAYPKHASKPGRRF